MGIESQTLHVDRKRCLITENQKYVGEEKGGGKARGGEENGGKGIAVEERGR